MSLYALLTSLKEDNVNLQPWLAPFGETARPLEEIAKYASDRILTKGNRTKLWTQYLIVKESDEKHCVFRINRHKNPQEFKEYQYSIQKYSPEGDLDTLKQFIQEQQKLDKENIIKQRSEQALKKERERQRRRTLNR